MRDRVNVFRVTPRNRMAALVVGASKRSGGRLMNVLKKWFLFTAAVTAEGPPRSAP